MDVDHNKRNRSSNWSESEKALLTQLIIEKISIIENKDITKKNNRLKKIAWQEVLQSYNALSDTKRNLPQLLNQWRNTKNNIKKYRRNCNTSGGALPPRGLPPEHVEIMEILPEFVTDHSIFDSDSSDRHSLITKDESATDERIIEKSLNTNNDQPGCSRCSSSMSPTQTGQASSIGQSGEEPKAPTKKMFKRKVAAESTYSKELFILAKSVRVQQIKQQKKEHELKMKIMEEEHKMRLKILQKELECFEKNYDV